MYCWASCIYKPLNDACVLPAELEKVVKALVTWGGFFFFFALLEYVWALSSGSYG